MTVGSTRSSTRRFIQRRRETEVAKKTDSSKKADSSAETKKKLDAERQADRFEGTGKVSNPLRSAFLGAALSPTQASLAKQKGQVERTTKLDGSKETSVLVDMSLESSKDGTSKDGKWSGKIAGGPYSNAKITMQEGKPAADGRIPVEVELSTETGVRANAEVKGGVVGGGVGAKEGHKESIKYTMNLKPEEYQAMLRGEKPFPNPDDPATMPPGTTITRRSDDVSSTSQSNIFRGIKGDLETSSTSGLAFNVEKLDENKVRISTGPRDAIEKQAALGVGVEVGGVELSAQLTGDHKVELQKMQSVDIDISTKEGKAAYETFLKTGQLPDEAPPAIENKKTVTTLSDTHTSGVSLKAGDHALKMELGDVKGVETRTTTKDGTQFTYEGDGTLPNSVKASGTIDENGKRDIKEVELTLDNKEQTLPGGWMDWLIGAKPKTLRPAGYILDGAGVPRDADKAVIKLDKDGMERLQMGAIKHAREKLKYDPRSPFNDNSLSDKEWAAKVREFEKANGHIPQVDHMTAGLIKAESTNDIARFVASRAFSDHPSGVISERMAHYQAAYPEMYDQKSIQVRGG